ncbi:phospholipid-binding protein [Neorhizobium sp. P12A]|uniref:YbhB/YbcL family Raf kinase inhibitor-like protein n=1 Tax=Rhizobium/Agrobacterium group TaxID=227290 RepID=UPI00104999FB|nr:MULTISPECIES: YbhB/YbcL family Raf kinase inhibitor-like protein [Rhizobium/Agrobacterium group]KAA0680253.1 phospholipid-binding protein [Neorhizobium sp. P12A]TCR67852.1 hypothetical protein EV561_14910 [Rhizobium sp. BK376]
MRRSFLLLGAFALLSACTSVPNDAAPLSVSFTFSPSDRCGETSPAISVAGAPAGTASYKVSMSDRDAPGFNHGGGTVAANGGTIPRGALKSFTGPCPPTGKHTYDITVLALDAGGKVLAAGKASQLF